MNRISPQLTAEANAAMNDLFDSFSKSEPIVFYKIAAETVVVNDPNYNTYFPDNNSITYTSQSQSFTCRVIYLDKQEFASFIGGGSDLGVKGSQLYNRIKIQIKSEGFEYLKDTQKFIFWDEEYKMSEPWRRIGMLKDDQLFQVILERIL